MQIAKSTFGMAKVLEEQQLEVSEEAITAEMECAQQEFRQEGTELDADRLREQVIEGLEVRILFHR
jgi:FKBP-type peptidyl-prolyl cis-trans isomerase (trigger factor)